MLLEGGLYKAFAASNPGKEIGNYCLQKLNAHHLRLSLFLISTVQLVAEVAEVSPGSRAMLAKRCLLGAPAFSSHGHGHG